MTTDSGGSDWRRILAAPFILLAVLLALALGWYGAHSLLMLFAGILFAAFLDACTRGLGRLLPLPRPWRFALVVSVLSSLTAVAMAWGVLRLPAQTRMLIQVMDAQLTILESYLDTFGIDLFGPGGRHDLSQFIADPGRLFGHVQYAVSGAYVFGITTIVIVCLGVFFAAQPAAYRDGVLSLVPVSARPRLREVMDEMGRVLRSWLLGQLVRSAIVAIVLAATLHALGVPGGGLLGLQAGAANFVPYLGPLIAALPIALVAMPLGLSTLTWVLASYFLIQTIEGFVIAPLIQKGSVNVAPAWTLFAIVLLGALFGAIGVALAAPLVAVGRVAALRLYVEDVLHDRHQPPVPAGRPIPSSIRPSR